MSAITALLPDVEVLIRALMNTLMGMGTVFIVLIFISLLIGLFKYVPGIERKLTNRGRGKKNEQDASESRPAPKRPILSPVEEEEELEGDELIAVIMAAIVASTGGAVSADQLRIRSVRRVKKRR